MRYVHSMLAYVAPWVHQGIGCSGVPNFDQIEEMKDRATERIDGAIVANWQLHGVITRGDIEEAIRQAAHVVDQQNAENPGHRPLADTPEKQANLLHDPAAQAVLQIIEDAQTSPAAYVEPGHLPKPQNGKKRRGVRPLKKALDTARARCYDARNLPKDGRNVLHCYSALAFSRYVAGRNELRPYGAGVFRGRSHQYPAGPRGYPELFGRRRG